MNQKDKEKRDAQAALDHMDRVENISIAWTIGRPLIGFVAIAIVLGAIYAFAYFSQRDADEDVSRHDSSLESDVLMVVYLKASGGTWKDHVQNAGTLEKHFLQVLPAVLDKNVDTSSREEFHAIMLSMTDSGSRSFSMIHWIPVLSLISKNEPAYRRYKNAINFNGNVAHKYDEDKGSFEKYCTSVNRTITARTPTDTIWRIFFKFEKYNEMEPNVDIKSLLKKVMPYSRIVNFFKDELSWQPVSLP
jgi:hypothetical protein